ncbi:MAG: sigma-54-dependent Fis family transcriptional regulator [Planctomycetes bacterium]|nr:sigma-54-dependent Fis family transcriptional regulator [Planctomycetota bacterium]
MKPSLLIVDDDASILESLRERFEARGYAVTTASSGEEALEALANRPSLALLDLELPRGDGQSVLEEVARRGIETTIVVITAHGSVERAVRAMRAGAYDFVEKPFDTGLLEQSMQRALERSRLVRSVEATRAETAMTKLVAESKPMHDLLDTARKVAESNSSVLILGESGTGKELLARFLHEHSHRADAPFVPIHCAALSESLLESELFGHEKGAFTGAVARKKGRLEIAHGGTVFLDEIGDLPESFQVKLLRVLQERSFERVGGTTELRVDVRILAATHRDLEQRIREGAFREDLYYRLNVISLTLPPLRDRPGDVVALARSFVELLAKDLGRVEPELDDDAIDALCKHSWPGNVRELRNAIERALVLGDGVSITTDDLPIDVWFSGKGAENARDSGGFHAQVEAARLRILEEALAACDGNRTRAAERLGLQRTYFARLWKKYGGD